MVENLLFLFKVFKLLQVFRLNALKRLSRDNTNVKQGAHIHQPTAWPVPRTCAHPYYPGSASQLHSRFQCRHATLLPTFFVSALTGSTAAAPHNSFETTVGPVIWTLGFSKFPIIPQPNVTSLRQSTNIVTLIFNILTVADNEFEPICLTPVSYTHLTLPTSDLV